MVVFRFFFTAISILIQGVSSDHPVQSVPPRHPVCVCLCVSSYHFRMLWSPQCVAGRGPECDSLSQSHKGRKQGLFVGSFLLIHS